MSAVPAGTPISSILVARNSRSTPERREKSGIFWRSSTLVVTDRSFVWMHPTMRCVTGTRWGVAAALAGDAVHVDTRGREDPLPTPIPPGVRVFAKKRAGQLDPACPAPEVAFSCSLTHSHDGRASATGNNFPHCQQE